LASLSAPEVEGVKSGQDLLSKQCLEPRVAAKSATENKTNKKESNGSKKKQQASIKQMNKRRFFSSLGYKQRYSQ
jgi:hypothetical protein